MGRRIGELSRLTIEWVVLRMTVELDLSGADLTPHALFIIILLLEVAALACFIIRSQDIVRLAAVTFLPDQVLVLHLYCGFLLVCHFLFHKLPALHVPVELIKPLLFKELLFRLCLLSH